jgi:aminopeptidase N
LAHPIADKADSSDVWITAPKYFTSVSNGILEEKTEGTTTNTYKWKSRYPIANYLISIALANYEHYKNDFNYGGTSPMPVDHYVYPEYNTAANKLLMDDTIFMLNLFTQKFGPYPFLKEKYGHAMFGWGGGMEHQTISSMVNISSGLTAHELAHQWFGDLITCQDWANIWLNEGFATYGALIYWEAKSGVPTYKSQIISTMNSAKTAVGSVWVQNPTTVGQIFNGARSYSKGGIILHMLRNIVGDVKFYDVLRAYTSSIHSYGNATTEGFQAIVEAVTGEDFDYFFQQWVYGQKYPKYEFGWGVFPNPGAKQNVAAGYTLKMNINQLINTPTPSFFTMPIDLKITFDDNTTEILRVNNNSQTQNYQFPYTKNITSVTFDPENGILKDITLVPLNLPLSLEEPIVKVLENEKLAKEIELQYSPNPANDQLKIQLNLKDINSTKIELLDIKGKTIHETTNFKNIGKQEYFINTKNVTSGIYILNLTIQNQKISRKIIINH